MIFLKVIFFWSGGWLHFGHLPWTPQNAAVLLNWVSVLVESPVTVCCCACDEFFAFVI